MTDISKHPLLKQCYEVIQAIEECGASEKLTEAVTKAGKLLEAIDLHLAENTPTCNHIWITNSGRGGKADFKKNSQMSVFPTMHVMCSKCKARTWFTEAQWNAYLRVPILELKDR